MRFKQSDIYEKVCESLERDRVYLQPALSLSGLSIPCRISLGIKHSRRN